VQLGGRFEVIQEQFSSILIVKQLTDADNNHLVSCVLANPLGKETSESLIKIIG
jgi:hypothetical protein